MERFDLQLLTTSLGTHLFVAQPTREVKPDFTSILPLPKIEKLTAPNFRLNKDGVTDDSPLANALAPCCFCPFARCQPDAKLQRCRVSKSPQVT